MATWKKFSDISAWEKSRELDLKVFPLVIKLKTYKHYGLAEQMSRSSGSIMDNIAEGFGRGGNKEFKQFLFYSMGSSHELESQIIRCYDRKLIDEETYNHLINAVQETRRIIGGLINHLKKSDFKGTKFKN